MYHTLAAYGIKRPFWGETHWAADPCLSDRGDGRRRCPMHCSRGEHSPYPFKWKHARGRSWLVVRVEWQCKTASAQGEENTRHLCICAFVPLPSGGTKCARARKTLFQSEGLLFSAISAHQLVTLPSLWTSSESVVVPFLIHHLIVSFDTLQNTSIDNEWFWADQSSRPG